jgi:putative transposase
MNRGHNKAQVFDEDLDHEVFLALVRSAAFQFAVHVHGFALMRNHFHLQVTPTDRTGISQTMKDVGSKYTAYLNRKRGTIGSAWNGRYKRVLIEDAQGWLRCLKYIDLNAVRARIVEKPEDYAWTSYRTHAVGLYSGWLTDHAVFEALAPTTRDRQAAYRKYCDTPFTHAELVLQRYPLKLEAEADTYRLARV